MAILERFPKAKLGIGPVIENGFYYDFELPKPISDHDLPEIESHMRELIKGGLSFKKRVLTPREAGSMFKGAPYKKELVDEIKKSKKNLSLYETLSGKGQNKEVVFSDLCSGPHVKNTSVINPDAFRLTRVAGAYWRGDENNIMLTRIYGVAFNTKQELKDYLAMREEAEKRDHRKLGKDLDLFVFSDVVGKGLPLWTEKGAAIRRTLEQFIVDEEIKRGYKHVITPELANLELFRKSGHYPYYKDSMYAPVKIEDDEFMLRPMTCPHHFELYLSKPRSYRDLPMRIAELARLYRFEKSGELSGLLRVRSFCLADAHIICTDSDQAKEEIHGALDLIEYVSDALGLKKGVDYSYRLSLGDRKNTKKYYKDDRAWSESEKMLREVLKERGDSFVEAKDEAAFYGPKIDIQMKNVLGKEETAFTVQYDFVMPKRFDLTYIDKKGKKREAVVVHRSSVGAIERSIAFLIEHYAGNFPVWLSPVQVTVIPISEKFSEYAEQVKQKLKNRGIRVETNESDETLGKRIRESEMQKIPYILVIGEKEESSGTVNVRKRHEKKTETAKFETFLKNLEKEIQERK